MIYPCYPALSLPDALPHWCRHELRRARAVHLARRPRRPRRARQGAEPRTDHRPHGRRASRRARLSRRSRRLFFDKGFFMRLLTGNDLKSVAVIWWTGRDWSLHVVDFACVGDSRQAILLEWSSAPRCYPPDLQRVLFEMSAS